MLSKIGSLIAKLFAGSGLAAAQGFLKGKKSYALGALAVLQGVVGVWTDLAASPDFAKAIFDLVSQGAGNPNVAGVFAGLAMFTLRAGLDNSKK